MFFENLVELKKHIFKQRIMRIRIGKNRGKDVTMYIVISELVSAVIFIHWTVFKTVQTDSTLL